MNGNGTLDVSRRLTRRTASRAGAAAGAAAVFAAAAPGPVLAQAPAGGPVEPRAGTWKTWLLASGAQFRPPPPPDRAVTEAELRELKALAGRRDAATLDRIKFWDAGPAPYRWTEAAIEWTQVRTFLANGPLWRAFALVTAAMHDATVAAWDAKFAYNRPRPTEQDPALTAAVAVPRSPSYPSEHAAAAGAAATVLGYLFPADVEVFAGMAQEATRSRVEAGVQYPSDAAAGLDLGRRVGAHAVERGRTDNSDALAAELAEVKDFARTPRTTALALSWQYGAYGNSAGIVHWTREASRRLMEARRDADAPFAARLYALLAVGLYDTWIANQEAKFHYWTARPNQHDPAITTVFPTPNHPSFPSNRAALGMAPELLAHFFPGDAETLRGTAAQIAESALWAGIHFRSDLTAGTALGRGVARLLLDRIKDDA